MGRVTTPSEEDSNNGLPVQQPGTPNQRTRVPVSQFAPPNYQQANVNLSVGRPWSTGLFDCQADQANAVLTTIVPCVTFGQIAEVMDEGEMTCPLGTFMYLLMMPALCSHWVMGSKYREKMRRKFNLVEAPYSDCASHVLCPCCSLCQEYRELKIRNLDPSLGTNSKRQIQIYIYGPGILFDISVQVW
ncbi:PLAC8 family protein [Arabidopsis thaliana]|jgi:Cys-rich protein (TIGR01571 family)|uniref:PLAC8 family protein n=1 Tax=Arabidopsis thaliana TaxID=3702 RepID=A0A1P8ASJ0_ARATH|nr:PLAC8 family protein [Arabidopsis thaliana]ANM59619.1 PLAC8 family protein [Arabidopsis thaliana]|eukprot:NP_001321964.1 PLAC8 family protein [Arabidopsis thaliana]